MIQCSEESQLGIRPGRVPGANYAILFFDNDSEHDLTANSFIVVVFSKKSSEAYPYLTQKETLTANI